MVIMLLLGHILKTKMQTCKLQNNCNHIFERDTSGNWSQKPKIVANDREAYDRFGQSVAISGNYAIVGAHNEDPNNKVRLIF